MRIIQIKVIERGSSSDLEHAMNEWLNSMADQEITIMDIKYTHTHLQTQLRVQFVAYIQYK